MKATVSSSDGEEVKSRLLQLSAFENLLERFVELLPRWNTRTEIAPAKDVVVLSQDKGEYRAASDAPRFTMTMSSVPAPGWYYLEAALTRNTGSRDAYIEVIASGASHKISIPTNLRGSAREVFLLPEGVTHLHWTPTAAPGFFSQSPLLIHKISAAESFLRRAHRVIFDLWRFRHRAPAARAGLSWTGAVRDLSDAYERTVRLRAQRLAGNDYPTFIEVHDTLRKSDLRALRHQLTKLPSRPVFSLVMPLRAADPNLLCASLQALRDQIYADWELLVVSAGPASGAKLEPART